VGSREARLESSILISGASIAGPTDFVDEHGHAIASFAGGTDDTAGGTAELEILRAVSSPRSSTSTPKTRPSTSSAIPAAAG
jgi:hypothetical protein